MSAGVPAWAEIRVGTSGWSYPSGKGTWNGIFYPAPAGAASRAARRSSTSSRSTPSTSTPSRSTRRSTACRPRRRREGWAERTPPDFEFSLKLFQKFTHPEMFAKATGGDPSSLGQQGRRRVPRGARAAGDGRQARRAARAVPGQLQERAGVARLPGVAARTRSRTIRVAVELRHRSWSDDPTETLAAARRVRRGAGRRSTSRSSRLSIRQNLLPNVQHASTTCACTAGTPRSGGSTRSPRTATTTSTRPRSWSRSPKRPRRRRAR